MDVRRLTLLRELSRHGTIAATARTCSLTPSAVSQQLTLLEREIGTPLLIRDGRRLVLTEAARLLVGHTEDVLAELERARASVAELTSVVRGVLRMSAFPTAARALAPQAIARSRQRYPDLRVELSEEQMPDALAAVVAGSRDLALIYEYNLLPRVRDAGVETEALLREPLLAAVPADDQGGGPVALADLAERSWIAPHGDAALRTVLDRACAIAGFEARVDYASGDYTAIFALVRAGLGVALVPRLALEPSQDDMSIREVTGAPLVRTISMAVRAGSRRNPGIAVMLDELRLCAAQINPADASGDVALPVR
jgi:DNA-binding transcriptional LysR family regulator